VLATERDRVTNQADKNILLCTLGQTWAVIPEVFALLDPERCPLYRDHPGREAIDQLRHAHHLQPVDEIWVCTTDAPGLDEGLACLTQWRDRLLPGMPLRIWRTAEVQDVADQIAGDRVRELIYRAVLYASELTGDRGRLYLSLAGGRKTMSADMQRAGMLIGCSALLHVIAPPRPQMTPAMQEARPETFTRPLAPEDCDGLLPLVVGQGRRSEVLDIQERGCIDLASTNFPLPEGGGAFAWTGQGHSLPAEIERREREGSRLLGNYVQLLAREEHHENWRSLYRLPPADIERLRHTRLSDMPRDWIVALPKVDLHRHIGGCLNIEAQRRVGRAIWSALTSTERNRAIERVRPLLDSREWDWNWPDLLKAQGDRAHNAAALLVQADDEQLQHNLFEVTRPRHGLQDTERGFAAYERPGELSGSAVLRHPAALEPYMEALLEDARAEGLRYLELRGSPQKYRETQREQIDFLRRVQAVAAHASGITLRFLIIADRRRPGDLENVVSLAVEAREQLQGFVVGLDLAGDEMGDGTDAPREIARYFEPAFRACLPITIHAGEGTEADKIWEAAYRLHADRIGHGLTLDDHPQLLQRFRDRDICIELCPSSNDEVVGYQNREYPLRSYWSQGVPLAVCTDNPGISRTDATGELYKAAEFWPDLNLWDALAMVKQGFTHAFLPSNEREALVKAVDHQVYEWVLDGLRQDWG